MQNKIFRQKSLDKISSPEQLNDYIRVTNPGVWLLLISITLILIGSCCWGILGEIKTYEKVPVLITDNSFSAVVSTDHSRYLKPGEEIFVKGTGFIVDSISSQNHPIGSEYDSHIVSECGYKNDEPVYDLILKLPEDNEDFPSNGCYTGNIVVETLSPASFVLNN